MLTSSVQVGPHVFEEDGPLLQAALARLHDTRGRPRCLCVEAGVDLYVARHRHYVLKRLPGTGADHDPTCPHYEFDALPGGLGVLIGDAVIEHAPDAVELRVDFPLSRWPGRRVAGGVAGGEGCDVHVAQQRFGLLAVLHYLYERAGLNRWYPAMQGARNQGVLCKYLLAAAEEIRIKSERLADRLYVPEPWRAEAMDEIAARRRHKLAVLHAAGADGRFKLALVVGEFKGSEPAAVGRRLLVKHMPDAPLIIEAHAWARAQRLYGALMQAQEADASRRPKLLVAALIHAAREQVYQVDTLAMMLATDTYLPVDGPHELPLIERLVDEQRAFLKPLHYGLRQAAELPSALLLDSLDAAGRPVPAYVISAFANANERSALESAARANAAAWVWHTDREMPALPRRTIARGKRASTAAP
jgi:hypothetical protein